MTLRVGIQQDDMQAAHRQFAGDVRGERGLADAAFWLRNAKIMARPSELESRLAVPFRGCPPKRRASTKSYVFLVR